MRRALLIAALSLLLPTSVLAQIKYCQSKEPGCLELGVPDRVSVRFSTPIFSWYVDAVSGNDSNGCKSSGDACATLAAVAGKSGYAVTQRIAVKVGSTFILAPPATGVLAWYTGSSLSGSESTAIATWADSSGAGFTATQGTEANKPFLTYIPFAPKAAVAFDGGLKWLTLPGGLSVNSRDVTILIATVLISQSNQPIFVAFDGPAAYEFAPSDTSAPIAEQLAYWIGTGAKYSDKYVPAGRAVHGFTGNASNVIFHNVLGDVSTTAFASDTRGGNRIGGWAATAQFDTYGAISEVLIYTAMNASTLSAARNYLNAKYGVRPGPFTHQVAFVGNSLTSGNKATKGMNYPSQAMAALGANFVGYNAGIPSRTTTQMISDAALKIDAFYNAGYTKNILVAWEVRNDIVIGLQTAAQAYTNLVTYCQARQAAGWKVIVATVLPSGGGLDDGDRATVNTNIRTNWATFADGLADVAADSRIGDNGDNADTTYYDADTVHLNSTGYGVVAGIVLPQITALQ